MLQIKVPFLQPAELDRAANELLHRYGEWRHEPAVPPIDVDEIVEGYLGLILEVVDLKGHLGMDDVLGATWLRERRVCIDRTLEAKQGRFAFTVAHEIGHWELHRPLFELEKLVLSLFPSRAGAAAGPAIVCRTKDRKAPAEWQADQFAARLLMPARAVRSTARDLFGDEMPVIEGLGATRKTGMLTPHLRSLADDMIAAGNFSNVSNEAMSYRLVELKVVLDAEESRARLI
jgi:Zn-dependent peptidase ImmA (M78 family)